MSGGVITVSPAAPMRRLTCSWVSDRASMTVAGAPARRIAAAKAVSIDWRSGTPRTTVIVGGTPVRGRASSVADVVAL